MKTRAVGGPAEADLENFSEYPIFECGVGFNSQGEERIVRDWRTSHLAKGRC